MARKRMIDPGLWESRQFSQLDFFERVLYIGLISNADDEGRLEYRPTLVRSKIFPDDDVDIESLKTGVNKLLSVGLIDIYEADGYVIIQHPKWGKYQNINRPKPSKFPAKCGNHLSITDESLTNHGNVTDESRLKEVKGKEKKGRGNARAREAEKHPPKTILENFQPTPEMIDEVKAKYGFSDSTIEIETRKFIEHRRAAGRDPADPTADWMLWILREWKHVGGPQAQEAQAAKELDRLVAAEIDAAWQTIQDQEAEEARLERRRRWPELWPHFVTELGDYDETICPACTNRAQMLIHDLDPPLLKKVVLRCPACGEELRRDNPRTRDFQITETFGRGVALEEYLDQRAAEIRAALGDEVVI